MNVDELRISTTDLQISVRMLFENEYALNKTPALAKVLTALPDIHLNEVLDAPAQQPVCRHLAQALSLAEAGPAASAARAISQIASAMAWVQNPRYSAGNMGADFMEGYAYCNLNLGGSSTVDLGLLLLGPDVTYPLTRYDAGGAFIVLGGSPEWQSGDQPWRQVAAGDVIVRAPGDAEGKRPGTQPMLALYAWG